MNSNYFLQVTRMVPSIFAVKPIQPCRHFSIHEHQAMDLLQQYNIPVPNYQIALEPDEAYRIAEEYGEPMLLFVCLSSSCSE
jgi:acyl-CoA synthetase (NDP forming)